MKSSLNLSLSLRRGAVLFASLLYACCVARADIHTNVFTGSIVVTNGDISQFFSGTNPLPGVCVQLDVNPPGEIPGTGLPAGSTLGLNESPSSANANRDTQLHPSGFNQRRIMSAFNPNINGGTIYVGVDLPGGTGTPSNPMFRNDLYGAVTARGQVLPFDADGSGEADFIGRLGDLVTPFSACPGPAGALSDVWSCDPMSESAGAIDDPRGGFLGEMEFYNMTLTFGGGQQVRAIFTQENTTAPGQADLVIIAAPVFGVLVSSHTGGTGIPQGFDVIFAVTNVNNGITNECDRNNQSVTVRSGSNSDGSGQGEDVNSMTCLYNLPAGIVVTKQCPTTNAVPGSQLVFTGTVTNTGQATLVNVNVVNNQPTNNTPVTNFASIGPGQSRSFSGSYLVPTNVCDITDVLTVTASHACTNVMVTNTAMATCTISNTPLLRLTKLCPPTNAAPGTLLLFTGTVTNTGNIAITNIVLVNNQPTNNTPVSPAVVERLEPGQGTNFSGSYTVPTNACDISDTVTATGRDVCGRLVSTNVTAVCTMTNTPLLQLTKLCPPTNAAPGTLILFTGTVTNTGTIAITNIVLVNNQPAPGTPVTPPIVERLEPGQGTNFSGSYTAPTNTCSIADIVTATGRDTCGTLVTTNVTATCLLSNIPLIRVTKLCPSEPVLPGGLLIFTGTVSNAGTITLTNVIVVNNQPTNNTPAFGPVNLPPGASSTFTGVYVLPPTATCTIEDTLTATGTDICRGSNVTHSATATCVVSNTPAIRVTKVCPPDPVPPGGTIMWSGTVSNSGNITLTNVTVVNDRPTNNTPIFGPATLLPGQSMPLAGSYDVPTNHPDCTIDDTLVAVGTDICLGRSVSNSATAMCLITNSIRITLFCPTNNITPPVADQMTTTNPICVSMVFNSPISFLKATLVNVPPGFGVTDGMYPGWCVDYSAVLQINQLYKPILYTSTGPLPPHLADTNCNWNKINYILNHKQGTDKDIQGAIWHFIGGPVPPDDPDGFFPPSATTSNLVAEADAFGCTFVPGIGEIVAIILDIPDEVVNGVTNRVQRNIIEFFCPTNVSLCIGEDAEICASASGPGPFTYMWFKDNMLIPGQTNDCLELTLVSTNDTGNYCVVVSGFCGVATNCVPVNVNDCPGFIGPIKLMSLQQMPSGSMKITLLNGGVLGRSYMVEGSTDLKNWQPISSVLNTNGALEFFDPTVTTKCFYRVYMEP